jgi:hypothetical protein
MSPVLISTYRPIRRRLALLGCAGLIGWAGGAAAADVEVALSIREHRFEPAELRVPAHQRLKLVVHNQDATAEEFESRTLNREKVIPARSKATLFVGPLKPGRYPFAGEYNESTAKGVLIAE